MGSKDTVFVWRLHHMIVPIPTAARMMMMAAAIIAAIPTMINVLPLPVGEVGEVVGTVAPVSLVELAVFAEDDDNAEPIRQKRQML